MMSGTVVREDKPLPEPDSTGEIWSGVRRAQWPWKSKQSHLYPKNSQSSPPIYCPATTTLNIVILIHLLNIEL